MRANLLTISLIINLIVLVVACNADIKFHDLKDTCIYSNDYSALYCQDYRLESIEKIGFESEDKFKIYKDMETILSKLNNRICVNIDEWKLKFKPDLKRAFRLEKQVHKKNMSIESKYNYNLKILEDYNFN